MGVITKKSIIYSLYIMLAARASIAGITPFGAPAFAIALMSYDMSTGIINVILYAAACLIGTLLGGVWQQTVIISITILLFTVAFHFLKMYDIGDFPFVIKCATCMVLANAIPSVIVLAATAPTVMDVINLFLQVSISFIMFFVYRIGENFSADIIEKSSTSYKVSQEEMACGAIMLIVALLGLPAINILGLHLRNVISICIIMIFSLKGGMGTGAAAGIMIGIITNSDSAVIICLFAFCGFLAGLLNKFGKTGVVIAFVVGNIILSAMIGGTREIINAMYESALSAVIFCLLPRKTIDIIRIPFLEERASAKKASAQNTVLPPRYDYAGKIRNDAIKKASFYSDTLSEMSAEFIDISTVREDKTKEDPCVIRVFNKVCSSCRMCDSCWKRDYAQREKNLLFCKRIIEREGDKNTELLKRLSTFCIKPHDVINEIKITIEIQRTEKICHAKIAECKGLVVKQLGEMGKISSNIASEIKLATNYDLECEKRLIDELKRNELYIHDAVVIKNRYDMPEITLYTYKDYNKDRLKKLVEVVSKETGKRMLIQSIHSGKKKNSIKEIRIGVKPYITSKAYFYTKPVYENEDSGDSFGQIELSDGRSFYILSDGMGTGRKAYEQSNAVVHLMELYIKSGIDISSAVSMVNMMLTSGNIDVVTSSVDICYINRHEKKAYFVKMGAVPSVIVNKENFRVVEINQPPAGVSTEFDDIMCKMTEYDINAGDKIVLFTDGVYDSFEKAGINRKVFYEYIASTVRKYKDSDDICKDICEEIVRKSEELTQKADDMSALVISVSDI